MTWQEALEHFAHVTDKLGKKIDKGILDTVVALNMAGVVTRQSCEGHLGWGCPYPWVDVLADERKQQHQRLLYDLLSRFYCDRQIDFDTVLILDGRRIRSHGGVISELRSETEQAQKLVAYQAEMLAFTEFLKTL